MIEVVDAIDRQVRLERPPERVVSLVPSETASVADLLGVQSLVGRTDLVLANKEENSRPLVQALMAAGLTVHVSFPCTVGESLQYLESLCVLLGLDSEQSEPVTACRAAVRTASRSAQGVAVPVFVPIWKDPWMTFDGGAYASDILELCGARNVFADRPRRYPLAADLGKTQPMTERKVGARDTRYPRIRLEEVLERGPRAVLLPDEPYAFSNKDAVDFADMNATPSVLVELVDGKDLFWYGTRLAGAVGRLSDRVDRLRSLCFGTQANN